MERTDSTKTKDPSIGTEPESVPGSSSVVVAAAAVEAVAAAELESGGREDVDGCRTVAEGSSAGQERQS